MIVEKNILNEIKSLFPIQLLHIPYFFSPDLQIVEGPHKNVSEGISKMEQNVFISLKF